MGRGIDQELREKVWAKYEYHCAYCGEKLCYLNMHIDHIIPHALFHEIKEKKNINENVIEYGIHNYKNLNPSCYLCNHWKSTLAVNEFRDIIKRQVTPEKKGLTELNLVFKYKLIKPIDTEVKFYFETYNERKVK